MSSSRRPTRRHASPPRCARRPHFVEYDLVYRALGSVRVRCTPATQAAGFAIVFCQSLPPPGRTARFDLAPAMQRLGWRARDTFPANIEALCAADYTANPDLYQRQ